MPGIDSAVCHHPGNPERWPLQCCVPRAWGDCSGEAFGTLFIQPASFLIIFCRWERPLAMPSARSGQTRRAGCGSATVRGRLQIRRQAYELVTASESGGPRWAVAGAGTARHTF